MLNIQPYLYVNIEEIKHDIENYVNKKWKYTYRYRKVGFTKTVLEKTPSEANEIHDEA